MSLDYSLMRVFALANGPSRLQIGFAGYEQRQTTAKTGRRSRLSSRGSATRSTRSGSHPIVAFPNLRLNMGVRFFEEFANRAAYQGFSLQVSGSVSF